MIRIENGWLTGDAIRHVLSPNFDRRPCQVDKIPEQVSLLVIHNISLPPGQFGGCYVDQFFTNCLNPTEHAFFEEIANVKVSAHLFIDRLGRVTQYVSLDDRAWHAGKSWFNGRENCNDFSIGIELEGTDDQPYSSEQYGQLATITRQIMLAYPALKFENIVGHCHIAPDRKTDPGASFDWLRYQDLIKSVQPGRTHKSVTNSETSK